MMFDSLLSVFEAVVRMSVSASLLILAILGLYGLLRRWVPMTIIYVLGLFVLLRLAIPVFLYSDYSLFQLLPNALGSAQPDVTFPVEVPAVADEFTTLGSLEVGEGRQGASPLWAGLATVWAVVFVLLVAWQVGLYWRFSRWVRIQPVVTDPGLKSLLAECQEVAGVTQKVVMLSVDRMRMPAVCGLFRSRILLPVQVVKQLDRADLKHILLHELGHLQRRDVLVGFMTSLVSLVHWFNPVVWMATRQFSLVRELLCDRWVLRNLEPSRESERAYGETLLKAATLFNRPTSLTPGLIPFLSAKDEIKERLTMIVKPTSKHWLRNVAGMVTGTGLVVASMTLVALPNPGEDDERRERSEKREHAKSEEAAERREQVEREERFSFEKEREYEREVERKRDREAYRDQKERAEEGDRELEPDEGVVRSAHYSWLKRVQGQIHKLMDQGRRHQAEELKRKLANELRRREELLAKEKKATSYVNEENRRLKGHIEELSSSLRVVHEKMEKMQRTLDELVERR